MKKANTKTTATSCTDDKVLHDLLMDMSNCVTVKEARDMAKKRWALKKNKACS